MPLYDTGYQHWQGRHLGLWRRRAVIAANGLRGCLRNKFARSLIVLCWAIGLAQIGILFAVGQLLVADSLIARGASRLGGMERTFVVGLTTWLEQHPEISVRCAENALFALFTTWLLPPTMLVIALAVPHLITRDLSSQAITIYASKAVGRFDYLLGKWAAIMALMGICWLGPVCASWLVGNLLAPQWHFFWHSRVALFHSLAYVLSAMTLLAVLALGVSAVSSREQAGVGLWIMLWIVGGALVPIAYHTQPWLEHLSLGRNLSHLSNSIFLLKDDLALVQENVPVFGSMLGGIQRHTMSAILRPDLAGALGGFVFMVLLSCGIVYRRVKPE